jgi:hypothetical protein
VIYLFYYLFLDDNHIGKLFPKIDIMPTYIRKEGRGEGQRAANCVRQGLVLTFFGAYPLVCPHNTFVQKQQTGTEIAESHTHASHFILMQDANGSTRTGRRIRIRWRTGCFIAKRMGRRGTSSILRTWTVRCVEPYCT